VDRRFYPAAAIPKMSEQGDLVNVFTQQIVEERH
jgi:hypothetical protein